MSIHNPWRGLSSYEDPAVSKRGYLFCGRDRESQELFREIDHNPVVTLYGRSGLGKTSLLNAGVFPLLRTYGYRPVPVRFGTDTGQQDLAVAMIATISDHCAAHCRLSDEELKKLAAEDPLVLLWHYFHTTTFTDRETQEEVYPVLVLDQFEETIMSNREAAILLLRQMQALLGRSRRFPSEAYSAVQNYRFVIALREDYLYCLEDCITAGGCWDLRNCRYRLLPVRYGDARAIVLKPGDEVLAPADSERIADTILEKSLINPGSHQSGNPDDAEVNPQMVSLLCSQLFDKAYPDEHDTIPHRITAALLDKEKDTTLKDFYLNTIRKTGLDAEQQHQLEERLVSDGRRQSAGYNLLVSLITQENLDQLVRAGLLRTYTTATNREPQVEIIHDQIAAAVEEARQEWLIEEQKRAQKRKNRRLAVIVVAALVVILGLVLVIQRMRTTQERMIINQSRYVAEKASQLVDEGDSYLARRLLLHVLKNCPYTVEAESALIKAMKHETAVLRGHTGGVNAVAFSPDGSRIVSGSSDGTLILWDAKSGKPIGEPIKGHTETVTSVAFSPDGSQIVSGAEGNTLILWDVKSGKPIGEPMKGPAHVLSVAFSPDGRRIVSGSADETLILWNAKNGKPIRKLKNGHTHAVYAVAFSPDGSQIVSGAGDNTLILWDAKSGKPIGEPLRGHTDVVFDVAFSPDGSRIVSGSRDLTLILWDAKSGKPIGDPMRGHTDGISSVAFSPDGSRIVSGANNTLILWDAKNGKPIGDPMRGHTGYVRSVAFSPDGSRIVSGSEDNTIILWDVNSSKPNVEPMRAHKGGVDAVVLRPDGSQVMLWQSVINKPFRGNHGGVDAVAFSPDGSRIVSGSYNTIILWDAENGKPIGEPMKGHGNYINALAFSPNGSRIVSRSPNGKLILWDAKSGKPLGNPISGRNGGVHAAAFSPDGSRIVIAEFEFLILLDAKSGKPIGAPMKGHTNWVTSVAFSPDGSRIVSGSLDKTLILWDAKSGKPILKKNMRGHSNGVLCVAFSPDGSRIISGSSDKTLILWNAKSGKPIRGPMRGHISAVTSVAFSPDGIRMVSGSSDGTLILWDVESGNPIDYPMKGHTGSVMAVAFSPDGSKIVSGADNSRTLILWDAPPTLEQMLKETEERFGNYPLTDEEKRRFYIE
ncbi:MAG: WD40 repeat domain-containing protein [Bacteroidales bacterium]|nr:WD40 repeat domain-containing protein [Bacteroidales bacterium]